MGYALDLYRLGLDPRAYPVVSCITREPAQNPITQARVPVIVFTDSRSPSYELVSKFTGAYEGATSIVARAFPKIKVSIKH